MAYDIVVIGASLGGLGALKTVLSGLGDGFPLPVAIVQHREKDPGERLCELLRGDCRLPVGPVEDKEPVVSGRVYVAPPDYHLLVEKDREEARFALSTDDPVNFSRPSVDVLFESAADAYGGGAIGVILTGANKDGAHGLARIKERGGLTVVQDPATAEGGTMPAAAIAACEAARVLPVTQIGPFLRETCVKEVR